MNRRPRCSRSPARVPGRATTHGVIEHDHIRCARQLRDHALRLGVVALLDCVAIGERSKTARCSGELKAFTIDRKSTRLLPEAPNRYGPLLVLRGGLWLTGRRVIRIVPR